MSGVYLARHGRTAYNLQLRFQGQLPVPLDAVGLKQAEELAGNASGIDFASLWSSPLLRARQTADVVAERIGLAVREDPRLMETDAGEWTDRSFADVHAEAPEQLRRFLELDAGFAFPGGESFAEQSERVLQALAEIRQGPLPALVVCHGGVIRLALRAEHGEQEPPPRIENASIVQLKH